MAKESKNLVDLISQFGGMGMDYLLKNKAKQLEIKYAGLALCDVLLGLVAVFLPMFIETGSNSVPKTQIGLYTVLPKGDLMMSNIFFAAFLILHGLLFLSHYRHKRQKLAIRLNAAALAGLLLVLLIPNLHVIAGLLLFVNGASCVYCGYKLKKLAQAHQRKQLTAAP